MECPDFATLYKTIADELRQTHAKNPEANAAKEFNTGLSGFETGPGDDAHEEGQSGRFHHHNGHG
jgi:hypothetical protein